MYERFISSSMLTGTRFGGMLGGFMKGVRCQCQAASMAGVSRLPPDTSYIEIANIEGVVLDELAARFDLIAHQCREHLVGLCMVLRADLQKRAILRIHRGRPERVGIHLT